MTTRCSDGTPGVAALVLLCCAVLALAGFAASAESIVLEFWHPYGPPWNAIYERQAQLFMEDYPHVRVDVVYVPDIHERLPVAVAAGTGPDAAHIWGVHRLIGFSEGVLEPLDEHLARIPEWRPDDVIPGFLSSMEYQGRIWGLPSSAQPTSLVWGKDMLEAAGLAPIQGWPDENVLWEYSRALTRFGPDGQLETVGFLPNTIWGGYFNWAYHWGGSFYDEESGRITATADANVVALTWLEDLYNLYGGVERITEWQQRAGGGNPLYLGLQGLAIFSHYHHYAAHDAAPDWEYGFSPPPQMGSPEWGPKGIVTHTDAHVVLKGTEHPLEATLYVLYTTLGRGVLEGQLMATGHPSASISLNVKALNEGLFPPWKPRELVAQNLEVLLRARPWPKVPILGELSDAINAVFPRVVNRETSPRSALEDVERTLQARLDAEWERLGR